VKFGEERTESEMLCERSDRCHGDQHALLATKVSATIEAVPVVRGIDGLLLINRSANAPISRGFVRILSAGKSDTELNRK
jgi:hypothetical protein